MWTFTEQWHEKTALCVNKNQLTWLFTVSLVVLFGGMLKTGPLVQNGAGCLCPSSFLPHLVALRINIVNVSH